MTKLFRVGGSARHTVQENLPNLLSTLCLFLSVLRFKSLANLGHNPGFHWKPRPYQFLLIPLLELSWSLKLADESNQLVEEACQAIGVTTVISILSEVVGQGLPWLLILL